MSLHAGFEISLIYSYYKKNHNLCVQFYCLHFCPCFLLYCRSVRLFLEREPNKHMSSLQFQKQTTQALCHFLCRPPLHSTAQKTKVAQVLPLKLRPNGGRHIINFKILQIKLEEGYIIMKRNIFPSNLRKTMNIFSNTQFDIITFHLLLNLF